MHKHPDTEERPQSEEGREMLTLSTWLTGEESKVNSSVKTTITTAKSKLRRSTEENNLTTYIKNRVEKPSHL